METVIGTDIDWFEGSPLGRIVYDRTYSRTMENGRKEDWPDTCRRVARGNCEFVSPEFVESGEEEEVYNLLLARQLIPAGRHLWTTGVSGRQFGNNCHVAGYETGFAEHCAFVFSELMKGGGVGANYSSRYLSALSPLSSVAVRFVCSPEHADFRALLPFLSDNDHCYLGDEEYYFRVPDSREGWVRALEMLLEFATRGDEFTLVFDVSDVRPQGSPIKGFGGISSGPFPLVKMLKEVADLLPANSTPISPELTMKIDHLIASAVIAGNVRRSARMSIMHWNDPAIEWFLNCKADHMDHWSTNISVEIDDDFFHELLDDDSRATRVYEQVIEGMITNGEPGFFNSSLASKGERLHLGATNPCGELPLESWEPCCLGHINLAWGTDEDHHRVFRLMARFLLRATFCDIQDPKQREVVDRNRRIGVGFFGMQEWLGLRGIPYSRFDRDGILADNLSNWYQIVREESDKYADELGVNRPIKCTTIAPTGSIAKLAGTSEGMQPIYAKHYLRRVRYSTNDPEVGRLQARGIPLEPCIYSANTLVASFPCEDPILTRIPEHLVEEQHEIPIEVLLELQATIQRYYSDNAISLTINVPQYESEEVQTALKVQVSQAMKRFLPHIKGTTIFPEASRPQSPIERITKEQYNKLVKMQDIRAGTTEILLEECVGGSCPIR